MARSSLSVALKYSQISSGELWAPAPPWGSPPGGSGECGRCPGLVAAVAGKPFSSAASLRSPLCVCGATPCPHGRWLPLLRSAAFSATVPATWTDSEEAGGQERLGGERSRPEGARRLEGGGGLFGPAGQGLSAEPVVVFSCLFLRLWQKLPWSYPACEKTPGALRSLYSGSLVAGVAMHPPHGQVEPRASVWPVHGRPWPESGTRPFAPPNAATDATQRLRVARSHFQEVKQKSGFLISCET